MTNKQKPQYYCFECKFAKSSYGALICKVYRGATYGALICKVYRGATKTTHKACLDFELKKDFVRRKNIKKTAKMKECVNE